MNQEIDFQQKTITITNPRCEKMQIQYQMRNSQNKKYIIKHSQSHIQKSSFYNVQKQYQDVEKIFPKQIKVENLQKPSYFHQLKTQIKMPQNQQNKDIQQDQYQHQIFQNDQSNDDDIYQEYFFGQEDIDIAQKQVLIHIEQYVKQTRQNLQNIKFQQINNQQSHNFSMINQAIHQNTLSFEQIYQKTTKNGQITIDLKNIRHLRRLTPLKSLKKWILNTLQYSSSLKNIQQIELSICNLYGSQTQHISMPYLISCSQNLQSVLYELLLSRSPIHIRISHSGSLKPLHLKPTAQTFQVQFDSQGQLQQDESNLQENGLQEDDIMCIKNILKANKIQTMRYKGKNRVICGFCQKTTQDTQGIKKCGPFYGPFYVNRKKQSAHYVHLLCAIWSKKIYITEDQKWVNVAAEIVKFKRKSCLYCGLKGPGLECKRCNFCMHYQCGLGKCSFYWPQYKLQCESCTQQKLQQEKLQQYQLSSQVSVSRQSKISHKIPQKMQIQQPQQTQNLQIKQINIQDNENKFLASENKIIAAIIMQIEPEQTSKKSFSRSKSKSKTQTISRNPIKPQNKLFNQEKELLSIDKNSQFEVNSSDVQILQERCKPAKMKIEVKLQEPESSFNQQKPRRGRPKRTVKN